MMRHSEAGFVLVEVLVAFAVAAALLGLGFELLSTNLGALRRTGAYEQALLLAESRLEELSTGAPPAEDAGETDDGFAWRIDAVRDPAAPSSAKGPALYQVRVTVSWQQGLTPRSVSLASLRLTASAGGDR
jgi:general secretion pathway protein I